MTVSRRQLVPFAALSATYFGHIGFFNPYLPLWLKEQGLSLFVISLLTAVPSLTRLVGPYAWGWLSDHTGERVKLLRCGATAAWGVSLGLWVDAGVAWLALVLFLMFVHTSAMMPMSEATMAHLVSAGGDFNARRYGRVRLFGSLGFLLTVFLAGAGFEQFGLGYFPLVTVISLGLVVACVWWLPDLKEDLAAHEKKRPVLPILRQRPVQWLFASIFFHILAHMGVYIYFSLHLDALGYSKTVIGLMWGVSVVVEIAWFFTQSRWLPLLSLSGWLVLCAALTALRMAMTAGGAEVWLVLLLAQCLHAFTFAAHHTSCIALISHYFPGNLRARGQALYTVLGYGIPGVLGGLAGGALTSRLGLASVFWAGLACGLLATACAWQVWRHSHGAHRQAV